MTKYSSSSSYSNYEAFFVIIFFFSIGIVIADSLEFILMKIISIGFSLFLAFLVILNQRKKTFDILFLENQINVHYLFLDKKITICYNDIVELTFISVSKSPNRNQIKYQFKNKIHSLKFLSVAESDQYIEFIKWIKSKNEKIELKVLPSDHIMNHKIQEVYGFKYRKFLKNTL